MFRDQRRSVSRCIAYGLVYGKIVSGLCRAFLNLLQQMLMIMADTTLRMYSVLLEVLVWSMLNALILLLLANILSVSVPFVSFVRFDVILLMIVVSVLQTSFRRQTVAIRAAK